MSTATPEGRVKEEVKKILKRHNVWYYMPVSGGYGKHGIPDVLACVQGRLLAVECKGDDAGVPTALQKACMDSILASGGVVFLATPGTLKALEAVVLQLISDAR